MTGGEDGRRGDREGCSGCPSCGMPSAEADRFCETCGTPLVQANDPGVAAVAVPAPENLPRLEMTLDRVAAVSDRGRRRSRNEDAVTVARTVAPTDATVVVVCDGVASTSNAHLAARAASTAAASALEDRLADGIGANGDLAAACRDAVLSARAAVAGVPVDQYEPGALTPSTTLVAAIAVPGRAVVASVGDSRAYWLPLSGGGRLVTVDDSLAQELIAEGVDPEVALAGPDAHTITRWIGADADPSDPALVDWTVTEPGRIVLCTDGLWNYFEDPASLGAVVARAVDPSPLAAARALVTGALEAGGADNVTVAVIDASPGAESAPTAVAAGSSSGGGGPT